MSQVFSFRYANPNDEDEHSIDWGWSEKGIWQISSTSVGCIHWFTKGEINEEARLILLERFGLLQWEREFPLATVKSISPLGLMTERRRKEKLLALSRLDVFSDTMGNHIRAEECV